MHFHVAGELPIYPAFLLAGVLVGGAAGAWRLHRGGLAVVACVRLEIVLVLAGLLGAKLYSFWERGGGPSWALSEITASYRYPGGIMAVVLVLVLLKKRVLQGLSLGGLADALAPSAGFAMGVVRLGCFAVGCCFGREADLPWAVAFPAHSPAWNAQLASGRIADTAMASLPVHPLQLYFAVASIAVALFVWWFERHKAYAGQAALVFLVLDGLAKLGLETLRGEPMAHLQGAALATVLAAASTLLITRRLAQRSPPVLVTDRLDWRLP